MCVPLPETPLSFMVSIWRSLSEACLTEPKKERHFNSKINQNDTKSQSLMFAMWFANNLHILAVFRLSGILASGQLNAKFATVICFVNYCFRCKVWAHRSLQCVPSQSVGLKKKCADKSKFKTKTMPTVPVRYDTSPSKPCRFAQDADKNKSPSKP